jgi:hypothetical protein
VFDNSNINGQITVKLKTNIEEVNCNESKEIPGIIWFKLENGMCIVSIVPVIYTIYIKTKTK